MTLPAATVAFARLGVLVAVLAAGRLLAGDGDVVRADDSFTAAFDALWSDMDRHYSYFTIKKQIDWPATRKRGGELARAAKTRAEFLASLRELLGELEDPHIWIADGDQIIPTHERPVRANWNLAAVQSAMTVWRPVGRLGAVGKLRASGYGYLLLAELKSPNLEEQTLLAELAALREAPGFIVDLRPCTGGDEGLAQRIASFFCERKTVYARHKFRSGPAHDEFSAPAERMLNPSRRPYTRPVVCLIGPAVMSSGEGAALMFSALPQVTTVGAPTRGASGNPQPFQLPGLDAQVWYSRWFALDASSMAFEGKGILPDIPVEIDPESYERDDPLFERGLVELQRIVEKAPPP